MRSTLWMRLAAGASFAANSGAAPGGVPLDEAAVQRLRTVHPGWNASLRTACVATKISGGHAPNALPQHVAARRARHAIAGVVKLYTSA